MNILDLQKRLHDKSIHIDNNGHHTNEWDHHLDHLIQIIKEQLHSDDHARVTYAKNILFQPLPYRKRIVLGFGFEVKTYCFDCDKNVMPILLDDDHIIMIESWEHWYRQYKKNSNDFSWFDMEIPEKHFHECTFKPIRETGKLTAEINVPSGNLIFANYFHPEEIYADKDNQYKTGHSINSKAGRNNLMQYLAGKDVGYGQLGNMSTKVFVKHDGTEVILGPSWYINEEDEEKDIAYDGFKCIGEVSCCVWRWQCADQEVLDKYDSVEIENEGEEPVYATVKPGKWRIEHYFEFTTREDDRAGHPYARLTLINNK